MSVNRSGQLVGKKVFSVKHKPFIRPNLSIVSANWGRWVVKAYANLTVSGGGGGGVQHLGKLADVILERSLTQALIKTMNRS